MRREILPTTCKYIDGEIIMDRDQLLTSSLITNRGYISYEHLFEVRDCPYEWAFV